MDEEYKYDVGFSFLQQDEQLAIELADRIRDRVEVFIYSEQQKELIANDGVDAFSQVFRKEARVVVVLYREDWGKTKWTRIEETAIKSRQFDEGFKFLVIVSLDRKHPVWYPETWVWGDLQRYGIDGLASVIETRVRETGGRVQSRSAVDDAIKLHHEIVLETKRKTWRGSAEGVLRAQQELETLFAELEQLAGKITEQSSHARVQFQGRGDKACSLFSRGLALQVVWHVPYNNTLLESKLYVKMLEAYDATNYRISKRGEPIIVSDVRYDVDLSKDRRVGWRETELNRRFFSSAQLADFLLKDLFSNIRSRLSGAPDIDHVERG